MVDQHISDYYQSAYVPEHFTPDEVRLLKPFFTNVDKPIFVVKNLPSEVKGALASRYSRATHSLRQLFLTEYLNPIIHPDLQKNWGELSQEEQQEAVVLREKFYTWLDFIEQNGGVEEIVNVQRGRAFFEKWLAQYGDDSIAELGAELVCLEGISIIASKEVEDKRIGISPLEKSTRYVQFWEKKANGEYQYSVPFEFVGEQREEYITKMNLIFDTYASLAQPYLDYVKELYPKGDDETDTSFHNSRSARRFDDLRELLPFSTQTNVALFGNGRAFEDLIARLLAMPLSELQWCGASMLCELQLVVPSFVKRTLTPRGEESRTYRKNVLGLKRTLASRVLVQKHTPVRPDTWVQLVEKTPDADVEILATYLFAEADGYTLDTIHTQVAALTKKKRSEMLAEIVGKRQLTGEAPDRARDRFHKVPRAFENASYLFEMWARGGAYRDLQRHRQATQERQLFTTLWGYDVEADVRQFDQFPLIEDVFARTEILFTDLVKENPYLAQYIVPFGYIQHWYMRLTAREVYWMVELRTGPQGHPHYRDICQQLGHLAQKTDPAVFQGLLIDDNHYILARRESEKKIEQKLKRV